MFPDEFRMFAFHYRTPFSQNNKNTNEIDRWILLFHSSTVVLHAK